MVDKYGQIKGGSLSNEVIMTTGQVFYANSAKFVHMAAGLGVISDDGQDYLYGYADTHPHTTVAGEQVRVIIDPTAVYRIPIVSGTYAESMKGDTCDIEIVANIQGADLDGVTDNVFEIVNGDLVNNAWVDVKISEKERNQQTTAS